MAIVYKFQCGTFPGKLIVKAQFRAVATPEVTPMRPFIDITRLLAVTAVTAATAVSAVVKAIAGNS